MTLRWTAEVGNCRTLVALWIAFAALGCDGDDATNIDDDLPRDLTQLVDCPLHREAIIAVDRMPPYVPAAFLTAEDRRFYVRPPADSSWQPSSTIGGAPIVQQIVRILPGISERCAGHKASPEPQGSADKKRRKTLQAIWATRLDRELTKTQILSMYLNHVYLGHGAYGVVEAAKTYFGKELARLTIAEAALLAGLVTSPPKYSPYRDLPRARERQRYVLSKMREDNHISEVEYETALAEPISLAPEKP